MATKKSRRKEKKGVVTGDGKSRPQSKIVDLVGVVRQVRIICPSLAPRESSALVVSLTLLSFVQTASAAVVVTGTDLGTVSQLPGSAANWILFQPNQNHLTDFSVSLTAQVPYGPTGTTIISPGLTGSPVPDGIYYNVSPVSLASFTGLGTSFNYANFNVYVLYGNENSSYPFQNTDVSLGGTTVPVGAFVDSNTQGQVVKFHITGGISADTFTISANGGLPNIGGLSFEAVPEPSTWAMMFAGFVLLIGMGRLKRRV